MSNKACDYLMRLQIPQKNDAIITSPEKLLPVGTQGQIMNSVRRRMPPGVNGFFFIAFPDLDFPFVVAIGTENGGMGLGAVPEWVSQERAGLPVPELCHAVIASGQNLSAVRAKV